MKLMEIYQKVPTYRLGPHVEATAGSNLTPLFFLPGAVGPEPAPPSTYSLGWWG